MRFLHAAFILASLSLGSASYAFDPPNVVYRISSRAPADVFSSGFPAEGDDIDLLHYVAGTSVVDGTSAYISTTQTVRHAFAIAASFSQAYPSVPVYIYLVRPTENFYSVAASLRFARDALPNPEVRDQVSAIALATQGQEDGHWAARGGITFDQISGVRRFHWDNGHPRMDDLVRNDNYLFLPAAVSQLPMPVHNATVDTVYVAGEPLDPGFMSAAIANMGCDQQSRQCRKAVPSYCLPVYPVSFKALYSKTVSKMIAAGVLSSSVLGQQLSALGHDEL